jgi:arabinosyltransferase C
LAAIPALYAQISGPKGASYLGFEFNTDDHMVYAAWMRQAMDGHFLFDNRFTTDAQPGLTIHLYFWILGLVAKLTGIPVAANLARLFFTGLFVPLLYRLVKRVSHSVFTTRLAVLLTVVGGGVGFLVWHNFGVEIVRPAPEALSSLMLGRLPIDVWQPEAFVFPSMLTNGLFMVSLCLIVLVLLSFLDARDGWKPVMWGALALGVLMNIHSYDVLAIAFAMVGFVVMQLANRQLTGIWLLRGLIIGAGAIPAALWFVHVLNADAVFQARAATPTFSANFRQVFFGYLLMFLLALPGLFMRFKSPKQRAGVAVFCVILIGMFVAAGSPEVTADPLHYFLPLPVWALVAVGAIASLALMSTEDATLNLLLAWGVMGIVAIYFPALFQRKLAMGLSVPWAILATVGFKEIVKNADRNTRNLGAVLVILLLAATSISWIIRREPYLIRRDVSSTTVHDVFLGRDEREILRLLDEGSRTRTVVLAMPGLPSAEHDVRGQSIPDEFAKPTIPDLNPIVSGLTGCYTYCGHWSETPDYGRRRAEATKVFLIATPEVERSDILARIQPDYIVEPSAETFGNDIKDLSGLGEVVYPGTKFRLIKVRH